jgi:hypothetical protein
MPRQESSVNGPGAIEFEQPQGGGVNDTKSLIHMFFAQPTGDPVVAYGFSTLTFLSTVFLPIGDYNL